MITNETNYRDVNEAFFPVEEQPVSLEYPKGRYHRIHGYKAIVETETRNIFSVVSSNYRLVLNAEAYEIADFVIKTVFEGKTILDFKCLNILMPKSKGSCRMDLVIPNNYNRLFGNKTESWTPFVRISNSYNRTTTLKYEIGFCRWICLNGVIFGQTGIGFSITHTGRITRNEISNLIKSAQKKMGSADSLWAAFERKMEKLKSIALPSSSALAIFCKVFDLVYNEKEVTEAKKEILSKRAEQIVKASKEYFKEMGNNAYAMMNVLTYYASFPEWTPNPSLYVDGYQRRVGKWVDSFIEEYENPEFNLSEYIGNDYQNTAYFLESLVPED